MVYFVLIYERFQRFPRYIWYVSRYGTKDKKLTAQQGNKYLECF